MYSIQIIRLNIICIIINIRKKSACSVGKFSSPALFATLSTPRAHDSILALCAPEYVDLAFRARCECVFLEIMFLKTVYIVTFTIFIRLFWNLYRMLINILFIRSYFLQLFRFPIVKFSNWTSLLALRGNITLLFLFCIH